MKHLFQLPETRRYLPLFLYVLLSFGAIIYGNLITLELVPKVNGQVSSIDLSRELKHTSVFLNFSTLPQTPFQLTLRSAGEPIFTETFTAIENGDFKNFRVARKISSLAKGSLAIESDLDLAIDSIKLEYRDSTLAYFADSLKNGNSRGQILLLAWLTLFVLGFWIWRRGLNLPLISLVVGFHILFLWLIFTPMSGNDDTFHLPGGALIATDLSREEIRIQTMKLLADSQYLNLHRIDKKLVQKIESDKNFCPHSLAFPGYTLENCPYSSDIFLIFYARILRVFRLSDVASVETGLRILNQLVLLLSVPVLALVFSKLMGVSFGGGLPYVMASVVTFLPLVGQSMSTSQEAPLFLLSALLLLGFTYVATSTQWLFNIAIVGLTTLLTYSIIATAFTNFKVFGSLIILLFIYFIFIWRAGRRLSSMRRPVQILFVGSGIGFLGVVGYFTWERLDYIFDHFWRYGFSQLVSGNFLGGTRSVLSVSQVFEHTVGHFIGSVKGGIDFPPSPTKALVLAVYILLFVLGAKAIKRKSKSLAHSLLAMALFAPAIMVVFGLLTFDPTWIHLRFTYGVLSVYPVIFAAAFYKSRDFDLVPALFALVAVATFYLPNYILLLR